MFGSPITGWLFALEVIARKFNKTLFISCTSSATIPGIFLYFFKSNPLLPFEITGWKWMAIPFFIILSLLGGILSVYFTILVFKIKEFFSGISNNLFESKFWSSDSGNANILFSPFIWRQLSFFIRNSKSSQKLLVYFFAFSYLIKTIGFFFNSWSRGDGGVFAPSIVAGAYLGFTFALFCNTYFGTSHIYLNFVLVGAAATLSASIYAPLTAIFLVCNSAPNGYVLFFPILLGCWISKNLAKSILPYNVYTYEICSKQSID